MSEENKEQKTEIIDPNNNDKKVKFDEDQTKIVNSLYNDAFKTGAQKAEAEAKKQLDAAKATLAAEKAALETEVAALKAKIPAEKKEEKKDEPNITSDAMAAIKAQMDEMKGIVDTIKVERDQLKSQVDSQAKEQRKAKKKDLFLDAVTKAKIAFFDPLEAYKLAEDDGYEFDADSDKPVIKNKATGTFKLNENAEPMSVIDFVKDFAKRKNYLVQAATAGGTGASTSRTDTNTDDKKIDYSKMTDEQFEAVRQEIMNKAR